MKRMATFAVLFVLSLASCTRPQADTKVSIAKQPSIANLPVSITVKQRSTSPVPGTNEELKLTVEDITRGQVMVSLAGKDGNVVLAVRSLKPSESATFRFGDQKYSLSLTELNNAVIGEDFATFMIADAGGKQLSELQKIERLIAAVEAAEGAVFRRNGADHAPKDAADHLRQKLRAAGGRITTADQFIEHVASKSSLTGEQYEVRFADGRVIPAGDFFRGELAKLEAMP